VLGGFFLPTGWLFKSVCFVECIELYAYGLHTFLLVSCSMKIKHTMGAITLSQVSLFLEPGYDREGKNLDSLGHLCLG
jgi:hypothetical protein